VAGVHSPPTFIDPNAAWKRPKDPKVAGGSGASLGAGWFMDDWGYHDLGHLHITSYTYRTSYNVIWKPSYSFLYYIILLYLVKLKEMKYDVLLETYRRIGIPSLFSLLNWLPNIASCIG